MADFPSAFLDHASTFLSTVHPDASPLAELLLSIGGTPGSAVMPGANFAMYYPIIVKVPVVITNYAWYNGATVAGNVNVCMTDINGVVVPNSLAVAGGGGVAQGTASSVQTQTPVAPFALTPGNYFLGFVTNSATATFMRFGPGAINMRASGVQMQTSNFALANATFAANTANTVVLCGAFAQLVV